MKICPHCQNTYTDDSLQYCLQDGTPLANYAASHDRAPANWTESETVVASRPRDPAAYETAPAAASPQQDDWRAQQTNDYAAAPPAPPKSSALKIVLLTLCGLLALFAVGGMAAYILLRTPERETALNQNAKPVNAKTPVANKSATPANRNANTNVNANVDQNANAPTPTAKPTLNPAQIGQTREDLEDVVYNWSASYESPDLEDSMRFYADTVDYYTAGRVGIDRVRADKQRAFDAYDTINFKISNLNITPDATGERATAVFDKEWRFENAEKINEGKVQQQLQLVANGGEWRIAGEKDLKVYYINR